MDLLPDHLVETIAAEDESSKVVREQLERKIATLGSALRQLHRLDRHNVGSKMFVTECNIVSS